MKKINFTKAFTMLVIMLFAGSIFQSCNKSKPLTQAELEGYWVLKTMNGKDAKTEFTGALPTLQFNFDENTISGTGGCNQYNGAYTYKDGVFSAPNLAVTQMLCTEDNNEGQFILELTNVKNTLSMKNGMLVISHDGTDVLEFEKGSAPAENTSAKPDTDRFNGTWKLKNIDGVDAAKKFKGENGKNIPTLTFNFSDKKINGNSGCNTFNTTFSLDNDQLTVGPVMSTKMACPNLEGETQFLQAIAETSTLTLPNENILQLAKNGTVILEFEKASPDSSSANN